MKIKHFVSTALVLLFTSVLAAQTSPLYRVTVVDRTVNAVNYQYLSGPTMIDFRGTVLLPAAKGQATVESRSGRTEIDAHFENLLPPTRYGHEYLTYVLWAITPEGRAQNLGEIVPGHSNKAHFHVTTELQAFGLIVTAEPYAAVRLPGDVVVLENQVRPDTIGRIEPIRATYELLPRGHYTYRIPENSQAAEGNGAKISMSDYHQVVEIYEAESALQIAKSSGADQYAPEIYKRAEELLRQAVDAQARKAGMNTVVTIARQATQTAEDARVAAVQRKQEKDLAAAREQAAQAEAAKAQAQAAAQTAETEARAARALLDQERAARQQAQAEPAAPPPPALPPPQPMTANRPAPPPPPQNQQQAALRMRLLQQLSATASTRDTPRGLVVTLPDNDFRAASLNPVLNPQLARIAAVLAASPALAVEVDGNAQFSEERANAVREALVRDGVPARQITARGLGDSRPITSNTTPAGREQNRRVEIVVSGDPIGSLPYWAKSYTLMPPH